MDHQLNCLVVEDEPLAASVMADFIGQTPGLRLAGVCPDAHRALEAMQQQPVDVLFLDIHLPGMKGLDFLRSLPEQPQTILTTAFHQYSLESYDLGVVDYLLKPIDFQRFLKAVRKIRRQNPAIGQPAPRAFHFFNVNKKMVRVWLDEIAVVESLAEYVQLHLADGQRLVTKFQLGQMEVLLGKHDFLRVHRSFLVAVGQVSAFTATEVFIGKKSVPIGRGFKEPVFGVLKPGGE